MDSLYGLTNEIEALFLTIENRWFDVSEGKLTIEEIHTLHIEMKKKSFLYLKNI